MNALRTLIAILVISSAPSLAADFGSSFALQSALTALPAVMLAPTTTLALETAATAPDWVFGDLEQGYAGRQISTRLLLWSLPWAGAGIIGLWASQDDGQKGFWGMSGAWGVINSGIALAGLLGAEPLLGDLKTVLLINAGLDVAYMLGGIYLLTRPEATWRGSGVAVLIQGGFLLAFDLIHALLI